MNNLYDSDFDNDSWLGQKEVSFSTRMVAAVAVTSSPNLEEDSIRAIQQRLKTIDIRHFCNHQIYHSLRDVKSTLASLEVSIQVQMAYNDSILETADLHTERDTAGLKNKLISATNRKVVSKWIYNANLDPWINEFYKYNVKPGLHWAGAVPVLQEYVKYKMALLQLEEALEGKKRKSKS